MNLLIPITKKSAFALFRQIYKPGSVVNSHLSRVYIAIYFKPLKDLWRTTSSHNFFYQGVAPNRVYTANTSLYCWWAFTPPFHLSLIKGCYFLLHFP